MFLLFYISVASVVVFLFRDELRFLTEQNDLVNQYLPLFGVYSVLIFVTIIPWGFGNGMLPLGVSGFRTINLLFYLIFILTLIRVVQIGWIPSFKALCKRPLIFFNMYALFCFLSAIFLADNVFGTPNDYNVTHAFRMLIFFISISIYSYQKVESHKLVKGFFYLGVIVLLLRMSLPLLYGLHIQEISPMELLNLESRNVWFSSFSTWFISTFSSYHFSVFGKQGWLNIYGFHSNTFAWLTAIMFLLSLNILVNKLQSGIKYFLPVIFFAVLTFNFQSQTAFIVLNIGLICILISRFKISSLPIILTLLLLALQFRDKLRELFLQGRSMGSFLTQSYEGTRFERFTAAYDGFLDAKWFGHGFISGEILYLRDYLKFELPSHNIDFTEVHNSFLSVLFNTGLLGAIPFIAGVLSIGLIVFRYWIRSHLNVFSTNVLILFVSSLISSFTLTDVWYKFDDLFLIRMYPFFLILVLCVNIPFVEPEK